MYSEWRKEAKLRQPVSAIVVGAGNRGQNYAKYSNDCPNKLKIVSVCEPNNFRRKQFAQQYDISDEMAFTDWKICIEKPKFADCAFICTQDQQHKDSAVEFAKKGYHILLEKPMAVTEADCCEIVETCKQHNVMLAVCHVLRYTPQARKIKQLIESGVIGKVVNIQLLASVGHWHFAHSFVRGNWRNSKTSTFALLSKCCHDMDLLMYWTNGTKDCKAVSSFGSLNHFTAKNKPEKAGSRCLDCSVESTCPYSAKRLYIDSGNVAWPVSTISNVHDIENITEAVKTGPYGRCVYDCDNDVCDNQIVNLTFKDGSTASFTMIAFTEKVGARKVKVFGTLGELNCDFSQSLIKHNDFLTHQKFEYDLKPESEGLKHTSLTDHWGADFFAIEAIIDAIMERNPKKILTGPEESLASHLLCFRAEEARKTNTVVTLD